MSSVGLQLVFVVTARETVFSFVMACSQPGARSNLLVPAVFASSKLSARTDDTFLTVSYTLFPLLPRRPIPVPDEATATNDVEDFFPYFVFLQFRIYPRPSQNIYNG